ncbi:MAG: hypothetical protein IJ777_00960 [Clostridia bacterium]|nr:hypothetical protein [Clostridia bacterium]
MYEEENKCIIICNKDEKQKRKNRYCVDVIIFILSILLAFTVGLMIGSLPIISTILFLALAPLIILAIILAILIITRAIERICDKNRYK